MEKGNNMQLGEGTHSKVVVFPGNAAAPPKLDRAALTTLLASRVRPLQVVCGAMLATALMLAGASVVVVRSLAAPPLDGGHLSLILTVAALVILLGASRLHATLLSSGRARLGGQGVAATLGPLAASSSVLEAYGRATVVSYVLLDATASLGLTIAVITANLRYALVICGVAVVSMLLRWPSQEGAATLLRRRGLA
jgi:hypothetical protein